MRNEICEDEYITTFIFNQPRSIMYNKRDVDYIFNLL